MIHALVSLRCYKVTIQLLRVVDPTGAKNLECICLIWVIFTQETYVPLLLILIPQIATEGVLVLKLSILDGMTTEWHVTMDFSYGFLMSNPIFGRLFEIKFKWIIIMLELREEAPAVL